MPKKLKAPPYYEKDGKFFEKGTDRELRKNPSGSLDMRQFNNLIQLQRTGEPGRGEGFRLDKKKAEAHALSPYVGDNSEENWDKYFDYLKKYPSRLNKAASVAGFERISVIRHLNKHPKLKERFDDVMEADLDKFEENVRDIAFEKDKKYLSTKLKANTEYLGAHRKEQWAHKSGFSIESGRDTNINIINNTGTSLPGQKTEDGGIAEEV